MLNGMEAAGFAAARMAAERMRHRVAGALTESLPGVGVTVEGEDIVLSGRWRLDDAELRWIASLLR